MKLIKEFFESLEPVEDLKYKKELLELHNEIEDSLLKEYLNESSSLYICAEGGRIVDHYFDCMSNLVFKDYDWITYYSGSSGIIMFNKKDGCLLPYDS